MNHPPQPGAGPVWVTGAGGLIGSYLVRAAGPASRKVWRSPAWCGPNWI